MDLTILDTDLVPAAILDTFESLIWTDRFFEQGDFEIVVSVQDPVIMFLQEDYYLTLKESEHTMIIDTRQIDSDAEDGTKLIITGKSLESILNRRVIWKQTVLTGSLQNGIQRLLNENAISPTLADRTISNLVFEVSTDPVITALTIDAQYLGENLYEAIKALCEASGIGFKITLRDDGKFVFKLYNGADRSYEQIANSYVIFSPSFENLINSNYLSSKATLKTVALVAGEGEGYARKTTSVAITSGAGSGLARREMFTDAGDISATIQGATEEETVVMPDATYLKLLAQRGTEQLAENAAISSFEGEAETGVMFKYGEDFFMGDVVQIINEYGLESRVRVIEFIRSQSESGIETYPTFKTV